MLCQPCKEQRRLWTLQQTLTLNPIKGSSFCSFIGEISMIVSLMSTSKLHDVRFAYLLIFAFLQGMALETLGALLMLPQVTNLVRETSYFGTRLVIAAKTMRGLLKDGSFTFC